MTSIHHSKQFVFRSILALIGLVFATDHVSAGVSVPVGDGGVQIVFSDNGDGKTALTVSGTGLVNDDETNTDIWLGFSDASSDRDFIHPIPGPLADLAATMGEIPLEQSFSLILTGTLVGAMSPATIEFDGFGIDQSIPSPGESIAFFQNTMGMGVGVDTDGATLTVDQGNGLLPLPYSTFSSLYGQSFASTDGFTFVFTAPEPTILASPAIPDLQIGKKSSRLKGNNRYDERKASNKQTLVRQRTVFVTNTAKAALLMQNDGGTAAQMQLRVSGDQFPRMKVRARAAGGNNITGELKRGGFTTTIAPGGAVPISYQLTTNRYFAGIIRNGNRDDTVSFKMSGGGRKDNAAMVVRYREASGN